MMHNIAFCVYEVIDLYHSSLVKHCPDGKRICIDGGGQAVHLTLGQFVPFIVGFKNYLVWNKSQRWVFLEENILKLCGSVGFWWLNY